MRKISRFVFSVFLLISILSSSIFFVESVEGAGSSDTLPVVAIHVSEYTGAHWTNAAWEYVAMYRMLEEAFKADGTPFVEVSDAYIESGGLMVSGSPRYPILFSLASECISDLEADRISNFVNAGGFAYVGSSSWTRYADGSARTNFALFSEMGLACFNVPLHDWAEVQTATRIADNRLVNHIPENVEINWQLALTDHTVCSLDPPNSLHYAWNVMPTAVNPAQVLMTIDDNVMLAVKQSSSGVYIYHSELAPLASYSVFSPLTYEYMIFRQAVEWAFENCGVPLARLSAWPYQYNSAFVVRHDMDLNEGITVEWIADSAAAEQALGVTGQYYVVTGDVRDSSSSAELISLIQQAQSLGAKIGSHNGGLNCTPWDPTLVYGDYLFYHWGPDEAMNNFPTGMVDGLNYANASVKLAFDNLQSWLGQRPQIWVSPSGRGNWEETYQILDSLGILTSGEFAPSPYPGFAFSLASKTKTYENYVVPFSRWITDDGIVCQSIEGMDERDSFNMQELVDFYYDLGALVSPYGHASSASGLPNQFLQAVLAKPYMWNADPMELRDWGLLRQQVHITQQFTVNGVNSLTVTLTGSSSLNTAIDVILPLDSSQIDGLQVLLDGVPTGNYRQDGSKIKVQAGLHSTVTVLYSIDATSKWIQTSQADFKSGTLTNLNAESVSGQLTLAQTSLFIDDFSSTAYTSSHWAVRSGLWTVNNGYYTLTGQSGQVSITYTSGASAWTNYAVETRVQYVSGEYAGQLCARVNPTTGSRYTFLLYPNMDGPNLARLVKFSSWEDTSGTLLGQGMVPTDYNWHIVRMELSGSNIKCYYDGALVFNVVDSSYSSGRVGFESFGANSVLFDWVHVTTLPYASTGTLLSSAFDSGFANTNWYTISWSASLPEGTSLLLRTRTAATQYGLASAVWSSNYVSSGAAITSGPNKWIQYQATFTSSNELVTPTLFDVTIAYTPDGPQGEIVFTLSVSMTATIGAEPLSQIAIPPVIDSSGIAINSTSHAGVYSTGDPENPVSDQPTTDQNEPLKGNNGTDNQVTNSSSDSALTNPPDFCSETAVIEVSLVLGTVSEAEVSVNPSALKTRPVFREYVGLSKVTVF
jgi:hypothetical protein